MVVQVVEAWGAAGPGAAEAMAAAVAVETAVVGTAAAAEEGVAMEVTVAEGPMVEWEAMGAEDRGPDRRIRASTEQQRLW